MGGMLDWTDLFCGGGGSSEGLASIPGVTIRQAANHWPLAVRTHQENHPETDHDCADISQVDPRRYHSTRFAWISPDCTNHTKATGRKRDLSSHISDGRSLPSDPAERSRATMWDVVRFAEFHRYDAVIVENVIEVAFWAPFQAWLSAMHALGYAHEMVWMSSAHASAGGAAAATNRNRWYCVFTKVGAPRPDLAKWTSPVGTCHRCDHRGRLAKWWKKGSDAAGGVYKRQYLWRCSECATLTNPDVTTTAEIVDWTNPGGTIADRTRILSPNTIRKIGLGLPKHAVDGMAMPFIVELRGGGSTTRAITDPLATITAQGNHHSLLVPPGYDPVTGKGSLTPEQVRLEDCRYRLLTVDERKHATAFPGSYVLLGEGDDQVRMIGNAVTPPAARVLGAAVIEAFVGSVDLNLDAGLELAA